MFEGIGWWLADVVHRLRMGFAEATPAALPVGGSLAEPTLEAPSDEFLDFVDEAVIGGSLGPCQQAMVFIDSGLAYVECCLRIKRKLKPVDQAAEELHHIYHVLTDINRVMEGIKLQMIRESRRCEVTEAVETGSCAEKSFKLIELIDYVDAELGNWPPGASGEQALTHIQKLLARISEENEDVQRA